MKRRSFLTRGLATAGAVSVLPALPVPASVAGTARTGTAGAAFWSRYLTALHGPVSARHVAIFSGNAAATAAKAKLSTEGAGRFSRWLQEKAAETVGEAEAPEPDRSL